jgi:hypothetical protein
MFSISRLSGLRGTRREKFGGRRGSRSRFKKHRKVGDGTVSVVTAIPIDRILRVVSEPVLRGIELHKVDFAVAAVAIVAGKRGWRHVIEFPTTKVL